MARVSIYGLKDPRDGQIHYIGKANRPEWRLKAHLRDKETNPDKAAWIESLRRDGLEPELEILEWVLEAEWADRERAWIAQGRDEGWPLTNIADGGPGWGGEPEEPFYLVMGPYLSAWHWERYKGYSEADQWAIGRAACLAMGHYSKASYRAFAVEDGRWYRRGIEGDIGAETAQALIEAYEGMGPVTYEFLLACIDQSMRLLDILFERTRERVTQSG